MSHKNLNIKKLYKQLLEDLPSMMESNINDTIEHEPWEPSTNLQHLLDYLDDVEHEINYEISENYENYSKEELDKLQNTINNIRGQIGKSK